MKIISKSEKETRKIATDFAKKLRGGEVILMYGDLGAGKTIFVKGLAKALGIRGIIKSPTFNIMKCYKGEKLLLCHIDAYRLKNFDNLIDIGAEEYIGKPGVVAVVEWAERVEEKLLITRLSNHRKTIRFCGTRKLGGQANYELRIIKVKIQHGKNDNERIIEIK